MARRIIAISLFVLAFCIIVMTVLVAFTPVGSSLFAAAPTPTPSPTLIPFTPTPPPPPPRVLTVTGKPPVLHDKAAYLLDNDTGHTLIDFHGEVPLPMASTTKIMTAVIAIQTADLNMPVTIHQDAVNEVVNNFGSTANLVVGDQIPLQQLLYGLMLPSGDDAAIAIADAISGSSANFVNVMNRMAYRLRLFQTHYINPDGLTYYSDKAGTIPIPGHYTTAYDLVLLAKYAMSIPLFAQIVKTTRYILPPAAHHHGYTWVTTNSLLTTLADAPTVKTYAGATGIKTGYTLEAGPCFVFSATRSGHDLIGVILFAPGKPQRFTDAETLLNWGFALPVLPESP